jgi:hypothetical protein
MRNGGGGGDQPNPRVPASISSLPHRVSTGCSFNLILSPGMCSKEHAIVSCGHSGGLLSFCCFFLFISSATADDALFFLRIQVTLTPHTSKEISRIFGT